MKHNQLMNSENNTLLRLGLVCGSLALAGCASSGPKQLSIDHKLAEPVCTGVTLQRIDFDRFSIVPKLDGSFVDPHHVVSLAVAAPVASPEPIPNATELINTGGNTTYDLQQGITYTLGVSEGSTVPAQLYLYDFQGNKPDNVQTKGIPEAVPIVMCEPVNLADLYRTEYPNG